jgi:hypothetical protein
MKTKGPWRYFLRGNGITYQITKAPDGAPKRIADYIATTDSEECAKAIGALPYFIESCREFVRKVECGEARSVKSYGQMKEALIKAGIYRENS